MSETRKLAAILVTDVVGYSQLDGADEDRTSPSRSPSIRSKSASRPRRSRHPWRRQKPSEWLTTEALAK